MDTRGHCGVQLPGGLTRNGWERGFELGFQFADTRLQFTAAIFSIEETCRHRDSADFSPCDGSMTACLLNRTAGRSNHRDRLCLQVLLKLLAAVVRECRGGPSWPVRSAESFGSSRPHLKRSSRTWLSRPLRKHQCIAPTLLASHIGLFDILWETNPIRCYLSGELGGLQLLSQHRIISPATENACRRLVTAEDRSSL